MHKKSLVNYAKRPKDTQTEYIFKKNEKNFKKTLDKFVIIV